MAFPQTYEAVSAGQTVASADINELRKFIAGLPFYNVIGAGATGDGTTDDTDAISALISLVDSAGGGTILFPRGTAYRLKPADAGTYLPCLTVPANVTLAVNGATLKLDPDCEEGTVVAHLTGANPQVTDAVCDLNSVLLATAFTTGATTMAKLRACRSTGGGLAFCRPLDATVGLRVTSCESFGQHYGILSDGVNCTGSSDYISSDNTWDGDGVEGDGEEYNHPTEPLTDVTSAFCTAKNFTYTDSNGLGFGYAGVLRFHNTHCRAENIGLDGLHIEDGARHGDVDEFTAYQCDRAGISIQNGLFAELSCFDITIRDSRAIECGLVLGDSAVEVTTTGDYHHRVNLVNVKAYSCGRADATAYFGFKAIVTDGVIQGCEAYDTIATAGVAFGFDLFIPVRVLVTGCKARNLSGSSQHYGIRVGGNVTDLRLLANDFQGNATGALNESFLGTTAGVYWKRDNLPDAINV